MNFSKVYEEYFMDIFKYICSLSGDTNLSEEITQEAFAKAFRSLDSFDGSKDIRAWLFTIAKNTLFSYYKKHKREFNIDDYSGVADSKVDFVEGLAEQDDTFLIHQYIHTMKEPYKEVFTLRVFGELPFEKIGNLFGKSSGWARVTYYRAKEMIKEYMEEIHHEK